MKFRVALAGSVFLHRRLLSRMRQAPAKTKVIPLSMSLAGRDNEYFRLYRKLMGLK